MQKLIDEYKETLVRFEELKEQSVEHEQKTLSGICSDLRYSIEWMTTARRPGNRRGIERRSVYQRTVPMDPYWLQTYNTGETAYDPIEELFIEDQKGINSLINLNKQKLLQDILFSLSEREREVFIMVSSRGFSYQEAADAIGISKSTVQQSMNRCKNKIDDVLISKKS